MSGKGRLTSILKDRPIDPRKLMEYGRCKNLDLEDLARLAMTYQHMLYNEKINEDLSPLHVACSRGKPDLVKHLLKEGWSVDLDVPSVERPLCIALDNGNIPVARLLIAEGADPHYINEHGSPMAAALNTNHKKENKKEKACISAIKVLLDANVSVNDPIDIEYQERPIHSAITYNLPRVVSYLLKMGADINIKDINGSTPLHIAVYSDRIEIIKLLARHDADLYQLNVLKDTPLLSAVKVSTNYTIETLIDVGFDVNHLAQEAIVYTALHSATYLVKLDVVKLLVRKGADVNKVIKNGATALHMVATKNVNKTMEEEKEFTQSRKDILEFLVEHGANINTLCNNNFSPLQVSLNSGFLQLAKLMLKLGANVNSSSKSFITPLYDYSFFEVVQMNRDIIVTFLEFGADYNVRDNHRRTPYHTAISQLVDVKFLKSFIKHGCPYNQDPPVWSKVSKCGNQESKIFFAAENKFFKGIQLNNLQLVKTAVNEGAVPTGRSKERKYPLHFVIRNGYSDIVNYLLQQNSPPNKLDKNGESPLYLAARYGHLNICRLLLRFGACYNHLSKHLVHKTPACIAKELGHKEVVDLLENIRHMFSLARMKKKLIVTKLESVMEKDVNEYLMFTNATNNKGETLMSVAIRNQCYRNVKEMMRLRLKRLICE